MISAPLLFSAVKKKKKNFFSTWQILGRLLSPTNFPHKHHGAISSRYAQIRAGEFGGRRTKEEDEGGGQLVF
jgi:hypothetical protein